MMKEFRTFVLRGNVLDLAVGVIIGAAFGAIVTSLTEDVLMPIIGLVTGGIDFTDQYVALGAIPAKLAGADYATLKKAGVPLLGYGAFITAIVKFLILAWIIFLIVRAANRLMGPKADAAPAEDVVVLREIRDELKRRSV